MRYLTRQKLELVAFVCSNGLQALQYLAILAKKLFKKIGQSWCYNEFKDPVLLITSEKTQMYFCTSKCLWKSNLEK